MILCVFHVLLWSTFWFGARFGSELHMAVQVLQPGRLAEAEELIMDEAILDVVELVDVLHNGLTLILYKVLDKSISADGMFLCPGTPRPM